MPSRRRKERDSRRRRRKRVSRPRPSRGRASSAPPRPRVSSFTRLAPAVIRSTIAPRQTFTRVERKSLVRAPRVEVRAPSPVRRAASVSELVTAFGKLNLGGT